MGKTLRRAALTFGMMLAMLLLPRLGGTTVAEQRARLPPPATCSDDLEGRWKSHQYAPVGGMWYIFILEIHRDDDDPRELTGKIYGDAWEGRPDNDEPGPCRDYLRFKFTMEAEGKYDPGTKRVAFGGTSWKLDETVCGHYSGIYNLDQFTGTIDPAIQEFQSVNNDGGIAVNEPTVFRRIECFEPPIPPRVSVTPPPFMPRGIAEPGQRASSSGCNLADEVRR